jgi:FtsP/CotA-like multicopper oxidase with cupredoxin domain
MVVAVTLRMMLAWWITTPLPLQQPPHPETAPATARFDTLVAPSVLKNHSTLPHVVEVSLTAAPARLALYPGKMTDAFAYNGQVPGPTLLVHEGDSVIVHFHNELPEPTTIHWHGMHLAATMDGSPLNLVPAGGRTDYVFKVERDRAGTYWYHPHPDKRTGYQVAKGLYGALVVLPAHDPLPPSIPDKLLILSDNRFLPDGSVDLPDIDSPAGQIDQENGREGPVIFVNGQLDPTITIRSGEVQRWRIVNASAARVYRLAVPGATMIQVGSDGGLFEHPHEVKDVLIANSERVEVLIRGTGAPGSRTSLEDLPYDRYMPQTRPADWEETRDLVELRYSTDPPVAPVAIPAVLRPVPALDTTQVVARQVVTFTQGMINGRRMDLNRVDLRARLGTTEIWEIDNLVGMDHPFHLHGFRFQVLDRDGVPVTERRWKDTVNVPKHATVRIIIRFDNFAGRWMFHCHILDHEDEGMMGILETY